MGMKLLLMKYSPKSTVLENTLLNGTKLNFEKVRAKMPQIKIIIPYLSGYKTGLLSL